jgi:hypothetical protein
MKIYINHFNLNILPEIIKSFSEYHVKTEEHLQIYSSDGIYLVDSHASFKLNPVDHNISVMNKFYEDFSLVVDPSFYIIEKVVQIPSVHVAINIKRYIFAVRKSSDIKLVIENQDIYFELPNGSNIEDNLVKEEIIEFLSLLN